MAKEKKKLFKDWSEMDKKEKMTGVIGTVVLIAVIAFFITGNNDSDVTDNDADSNDNSNTESVETAEASEQEESEPESVQVNLGEDAEMHFGDFSLELREAEIAEKDERVVLKLDTLYTNDSFQDETSFMQAAIFYVKQGDNELEEVTEVMTDPSSNYYYENATGIWAPIEFEFALENLEDDITINVEPMNEYEDVSTYTISLN